MNSLLLVVTLALCPRSAVHAASPATSALICHVAPCFSPAGAAVSLGSGQALKGGATFKIGHCRPATQVASASGGSADPEAEIRAVLEAQVEAWNRGDVDAFMQGYWKSDKTKFVGSNGVLRGWQAVLDRYRRQYPDRQAMGRLTFSDLEIALLAQDAALVLGHWQLEREHDRPGGVFTLVFRKFPEGWRIIHDHTSVVSGQSVSGHLCQELKLPQA